MRFLALISIVALVGGCGGESASATSDNRPWIEEEVTFWFADNEYSDEVSRWLNDHATD